MRKKVNFAIGAIITVVIVYYLLTHVSIADIIKTIKLVPYKIIAVCIAIYILSYIFRALRFKILLQHKIGLSRLFDIVCVHNMLGQVLPARSGEISYIYLTKKKHAIKGTEGLATLLIARVFDFISVSLIFFISLLFASSLPELVSQTIYTIALVFFLMLIFLLATIFYGNKFVSAFAFFTKKIGLKKAKLTNYTIQKMHEVVDSMKVIKKNNVLFYTFVFSVLIWAANYLIDYLLVWNMGLQIELWYILIGFTFSLLTSVLPIHGVGGFGTIEGIWAVVFISLGVSKELAILTGFGFHIIVLLFTIGFGLYGMWRIRKLH